MRHCTVIVLCLCVAAIGHSDGKVSRESRVTVESLSTRPVVGKLGVPIGNVVRIECHLVKNILDKASDSYSPYSVAVSNVDGTPLQPPVLVDFSVDAGSQENIRIRPTLEQMATAAGIGLNTQRAAAFQRQVSHAWVGKSITCLAYESGRFDGFPRYRSELTPKSIGANRGFHFQSEIVLIHPACW